LDTILLIPKASRVLTNDADGGGLMIAARPLSVRIAVLRLCKIPDFFVATMVAGALLILLLISPATSALADEFEVRTYGDASLRKLVDDRARVIYGALSDPGSRHFFLMTRVNPICQKDAFGTEVSGTVTIGKLSRIVATVWTKEGKYSIEFYRDGETLIMVYETFTFFEEAAPHGAWHNFMGLAAWERRAYFHEHRIGYAEARGPQAPAPGVGGEQLQKQATRLAQLLRKRTAITSNEIK
jgi:hypothetical protein